MLRSAQRRVSCLQVVDDREVRRGGAGLPGCWSQGETEAEAIENIQDAIKAYLGAIDDLVKNADVREVEVAI